jgi:hypothetical protein
MEENMNEVFDTFVTYNHRTKKSKEEQAFLSFKAPYLTHLLANTGKASTDHTERRRIRREETEEGRWN